MSLQMSCHECDLFRVPLHASDGHSECVAHTEAALAETDCSHYESMSLALPHSRIAFFNERSPAPPALPFLPSQDPWKKKQRSHRAELSGLSELTPAHIPHASLSPQDYDSPVHFSHEDQCPSSAVSSLVSFGGSEEEAVADDSMSLTASDAEDWMCSG